MELVSLELNEKIAKITINNGKVNAISHQVISEINNALDQAESAGAVVILAGQQGIFSAGYDLITIKKSSDAAVSLITAGSTLSRRMLSFPFPIIGVCTGHAIAQGALFLLSCDYRIGSTGTFKIGLNEVAIGMTMPQAGIELARNRVPTNYLTRSVINGELFNPEIAAKAGFIDILVDPKKVMETANTLANQMLSLNMTAHHGTKLKERKEILDALDSSIATDLTMIINI